MEQPSRSEERVIRSTRMILFTSSFSISAQYAGPANATAYSQCLVNNHPKKHNGSGTPGARPAQQHHQQRMRRFPSRRSLKAHFVGPFPLRFYQYCPSEACGVRCCVVFCQPDQNHHSPPSSFLVGSRPLATGPIPNSWA